MPKPQTVFELLDYALPCVEEALAQGEIPLFESAIPTWYDTFFTLCERLGVLAQIEALRDPRQQPAVPEDRAHESDVTPAGLDDPEAFPPTKDVFPEHKLSWVRTSRRSAATIG